MIPSGSAGADLDGPVGPLTSALREAGAPRTLVVTDAPSGLLAFIALDDLTLGPAAGGVRTLAYATHADAATDAARLAQAMTAKCALAGLEAGGGKAVVLDHPGLLRTLAFRRLGEIVTSLGGLFRTAGDLGTTRDDLAAMAETCGFVHADEGSLAAAVADSVLACAAAAVAERRRVALPSSRDGRAALLAGLTAAVQGCGAIGAAVADCLHRIGVGLVVADLDPDRARAVAARTAADVVSPDMVLRADVDLALPCAAGGVIDVSAARGLRAWAVVPAANRALASEAVGLALHRRGVRVVPDVLASAGAVVEGVSRTVMGDSDPVSRARRIAQLGDTAVDVLARSRREDRPPSQVARAMADARIAAARDKARARLTRGSAG